MIVKVDGYGGCVRITGRFIERTHVDGASAAPEGPPRERIAAGLRTYRGEAGLSLSELARRAGVAKSTVSQLEAGLGNPSVETLWALCVVLNVPFAQLVDPSRAQTQLLRAGEGSVFAAEAAQHRATVLAACPTHARRDLYRITAEVGHRRESEPHMPGVIEHVVLAAGRARVGLLSEPVELGVGDYLAYPGDLPHLFEALALDTWAVLISEHR